MDRLRCAVFLILGLVLLLAGAVVPAHFRAVDESVLAAAAVGGGSVLDEADRMLAGGRFGSAGLLLEVARTNGTAGLASRLEQWESGRRTEAGGSRWGGPSEFLDRHLGQRVSVVSADGQPVLAWALRGDVREAMLRALSASTDPAVVALLACRDLESTVVLPAVKSAAGQPMEAALLVAGGLVVDGRMHPGLALDLERAAMGARQGKGTERLENGLLDILGAARHLDWDQMGTVVGASPTLPALHAQVVVAGGAGQNWPVLASAAALDAGGAGLSSYLTRHGLEGLGDVRLALGLGPGAVRELLRRGLRVERAAPLPGLGRWGPVRDASVQMAGFSLRSPRMALATRHLLWLDGLFLGWLGIWYGWHSTRTETNRRFAPRPDYGVLGVLTVTAGILLFLVTERYIFTKSGLSGAASTVAMPVLRLRLRADIPHVTNSAMNEKIIGMLVVFFAIQFAIYLVGLSRLRHIRGQPVDDALKLRLLDNEESVFDAPLYLGIAGSVLALVMRLTGFDEVSLMASYSSTLFGILFCFILKVVHVRPYRQQLILESATRPQP